MKWKILQSDIFIITTKRKRNTSIFYVHFLWTMDGPASSYSSFLIHISSNVDNEDKIEPPIQTEYFLSGGAIILMVIESGTPSMLLPQLSPATPRSPPPPPSPPLA